MGNLGVCQTRARLCFRNTLANPNSRLDAKKLGHEAQGREQTMTEQRVATGQNHGDGLGWCSGERFGVCSQQDLSGYRVQTREAIDFQTRVLLLAREREVLVETILSVTNMTSGGWRPQMLLSVFLCSGGPHPKVTAVPSAVTRWPGTGCFLSNVRRD